jgi:hypothetical protein
MLETERSRQLLVEILDLHTEPAALDAAVLA